MPGTQYSEFEREQAVAAYVVEGTFSKAERVTGIKANTIQSWRDRHPDWWQQVADQIREEFEERHRANLTRIIDLSLNEAEERLKNGDERLLSNGTLKRVKVTAKDAATIAGICTDKLRISLGKPTSIKGKERPTEDRLAKLREAARQRAIESGEITDISPIDIEKSPDKASQAA